eukprot:scaffold11012_cov86-Skeletonema_dohrnii-CCMP3373.AAC.1
MWPSTEKLAVIQMTSSGHLRRCSDAYTSNQCLSRDKDASTLSWPTIMGRYDMAVNRDSGVRLRCLIRSPTTL